jgi:hypothetical protein
MATGLGPIPWVRGSRGCHDSRLRLRAFGIGHGITIYREWIWGRHRAQASSSSFEGSLRGIGNNGVGAGVLVRRTTKTLGSPAPYPGGTRAALSLRIERLTVLEARRDTTRMTAKSNAPSQG